jgi:hypothetical protein
MQPDHSHESVQVQPAPPPVIPPGYTFGSVTDKISMIVLTRRTPRGWVMGFGVSFLMVMVLLYAISYLLIRRRRPLGRERPGGLGV